MGKRPHLSGLDVNEESLAKIKEKLRAKGLGMIGVAAYTDFLAAGAHEVPWLEMQLGYVESCARQCAALGGDLVRVFTGYERPGESLFRQWSAVLSALREAADRAAAHGVKLVVQNHHDLAVDSEALRMLLEEIDRPNVFAGYDAWSPFLRGEDLRAGARLLAPRAAMTIVADYRRLRRHRYRPDLVNYERLEPDFVRAVLPGQGEIDYRSFFAGLAEGGFGGWAVYEMCSPLIGGGAAANLDRHARAFLDIMRKIATEVGFTIN